MLALLTLFAALQASPQPTAAASAAPSAAPAPAPTEDPSITKLAKAQYAAFASGKIDASQYSVAIPATAIGQVQAGLSALGPVQNVAFLKSARLMGSTVYVYEFTCKNGAVIEQLSVKDGKIDGIYFRPAE